MSAERASLRERALAAIAAAREAPELARIEREVLGKEGAVGKLLASIRDVPPAERKAFGNSANELKKAIEGALTERRAALERERLTAERAAEHFDPTLPARPLESRQSGGVPSAWWTRAKRSPPMPHMCWVVTARTALAAIAASAALPPDRSACTPAWDAR